MPYSMRKEKDGSYSLVNRETGKVKASHTSKEKASSQKRLLYAIDHGWKPTKRK